MFPHSNENPWRDCRQYRGTLPHSAAVVARLFEELPREIPNGKSPMPVMYAVVLWVFAGVHKKHQTHNHKRPSRGNKYLGNLCREKGVAW